MARPAAWSARFVAALSFGLAALLQSAGGEAAAQTARQDEKSVEGFGEARRGDVPEGTAEMMTPEVDKAIKQGLSWLSRSQNADGSFGAGTYKGNIAVTSLAALAFMASGSSPGRGLYGAQIDKALVYVMDNTSQSGFIAVAASSTHGPMYSHGFGTLFLAEAYGMTHRPEIREKLQKAVRLIIDSQNLEGGVAISASATGCRYIGNDLSDQCAAGSAERGALCAQGDGCGVHHVREAVTKPRRGLQVHASRGGERVSPVGRGRRGAAIGR